MDNNWLIVVLLFLLSSAIDVWTADLVNHSHDDNSNSTLRDANNINNNRSNHNKYTNNNNAINIYADTNATIVSLPSLTSHTNNNNIINKINHDNNSVRYNCRNNTTTIFSRKNTTNLPHIDNHVIKNNNSNNIVDNHIRASSSNISINNKRFLNSKIYYDKNCNNDRSNNTHNDNYSNTNITTGGLSNDAKYSNNRNIGSSTHYNYDYDRNSSVQHNKRYNNNNNNPNDNNNKNNGNDTSQGDVVLHHKRSIEEVVITTAAKDNNKNNDELFIDDLDRPYRNNTNNERQHKQPHRHGDANNNNENAENNPDTLNEFYNKNNYYNHHNPNGANFYNNYNNNRDAEDGDDYDNNHNDDPDYRMITKGDMLYILPNTSIKLECKFRTAAWYNFNFWDNPIVWYKIQHGEESRINMMGNIDRPFSKDRRMNVDYVAYTNHRSFTVHRFQLVIPDVRPQDSGQYACRVHAPENVQLMNVTYHVFVETPPEIIVLTNDNPSVFNPTNQSRERLMQLINQNLEFKYSTPSLIGCFVLGQSNCPRIKMSFGDHKVISNLTFSQSVTKVEGEKGMLLFTYVTWAVLKNYQPMKEHDGMHVTCSVHSRDGPYTSISSLVRVRYRPEIECNATLPLLVSSTSLSLSLLSSSPLLPSSYASASWLPWSSSSSLSSSPFSSPWGQRVRSGDARVTCTIRSNPPLTTMTWKINDVMTIKGNDAIAHVTSRMKESNDRKTAVVWFHAKEERRIKINFVRLVARNSIGASEMVFTNYFYSELANGTTTTTTTPAPPPPRSTSPSTSPPPPPSRQLPPSPPSSSSSSSSSSSKISFIPGQIKRNPKRKPLRYVGGCATCTAVLKFHVRLLPAIIIILLRVNYNFYYFYNNL